MSNKLVKGTKKLTTANTPNNATAFLIERDDQRQSKHGGRRIHCRRGSGGHGRSGGVRSSHASCLPC